MNKLGVTINVGKETDIFAKLRKVKDHGFGCCQLMIWDTKLYTDSLAEQINQAVKETGIEISTLWAGWSGPVEWNFTGGPMTLGLVPPAYRMKRAEELIQAAETSLVTATLKPTYNQEPLISGFIIQAPSPEQ